MPRTSDIRRTASANIRKFLVLRNMKDKELYERASISKTVYYRRLSLQDDKAFDLNQLSRIARVLKVSVCDLVAE